MENEQCPNLFSKENLKNSAPIAAAIKMLAADPIAARGNNLPSEVFAVLP